MVTIKFIAIVLSLAHSASAASSEPTNYWKKASSSCNPVPSDTIDVPSNAVVLSRQQVITGVRIWTCNNGTLDPNESNAAAVAESPDSPYFYGTQSYEGESAVWKMTQVKDKSKVYGFIIDVTNTYPGNTVTQSQPDGSLAWARWFVAAYSSSYGGPSPAYFTRNNTVGGATPPTQCPPGATTVKVPYTADFYLWYCPQNGSVPTSDGFRLVSGSVVVGLVAGILVLV